MVKGLGYSDHAYEAAKARLDQKYGGNRPQVQAYIDELRKMRPINADNPRELERFTDIVERTVVFLKENKKFADLEVGTLCAIVLEKLPQALLSQYYQWIKEKESMESLEELRHWVAEEAKRQKLSMICPANEERAQPSLISGPQKRNVIVPVNCATKNIQFGNVMCSRQWNIERNGRRQRNLDCVIVVWGKGTLVTHVLGAESVELTDARTDTIGYFMRRK